MWMMLYNSLSDKQSLQKIFFEYQIHDVALIFLRFRYVFFVEEKDVCFFYFISLLFPLFVYLRKIVVVDSHKLDVWVDVQDHEYIHQ